MKLRIQGNSLRIRVSEEEVEHLTQQGQVEEAIMFGLSQNQTLRYVLCTSASHAGINASFSGNTVTVYLPQVLAQSWISTDQISLEARLDNGSAKGLRILIEKDLPCQHRD